MQAGLGLGVAGQRKGLSTPTAWQARRSRALRLAVSPDKWRNHWPPPAPHTPRTGRQAGTSPPHHCQPKLTDCGEPGQGGCPRAPGDPAQLTWVASRKSALSSEGEWQAPWPSGGHRLTPWSWPPSVLCQTPGAISAESRAPEQSGQAAHPGPLAFPALWPASLLVTQAQAPRPCRVHPPPASPPAPSQSVPQACWAEPWVSRPSALGPDSGSGALLPQGPLFSLSRPVKQSWTRHLRATHGSNYASIAIFGAASILGPLAISCLAAHRPGPPCAVCLTQLTVAEAPHRLAQGSQAAGPQGPASSLPTQAGTLAVAGAQPPAQEVQLPGRGRITLSTPSSCLRTRGNSFKATAHPPPGNVTSSLTGRVCRGAGKARQRDLSEPQCEG